MSRAIAFLLVVAMHLLVVVAYLSRTTMRGDNVVGRSMQMVLVMVDRDEERPERQPEVTFQRKLPWVPRPNLNLDREIVRETLRSPKSSLDESADAPVDWRAEGEQAARNVVRSASERRPMVNPPPDAPTDEPKSTVFGSTLKNRRAGQAEILEDVERVFVTDNCYFEFELERGSASPKPARLQLPTCVRPATGGGANMFEHLTPEYLETGKPEGVAGR